MDPEREAIYQARALKCFACATAQTAARDATEVNGGKPLPGWYWAPTESLNGH